MTEAEWLESNESDLMLRFIYGKVGSRKLLLFICACFYRGWHVLPGRRGPHRRLVEVVERFADGLVTREQLDAEREAASAAQERLVFPGYWRWGAWACENPLLEALEAEASGVRQVLADEARALAQHEVDSWEAQTAAHRIWLAADVDERQAQCDLLRDLVGNPFRPAGKNHRWLSWNGGAIKKLAQVIYDERRFEDMPILADALEDAGCDDEQILSHCRGGGPHVRGCWALDLILGKE